MRIRALLALSLAAASLALVPVASASAAESFVPWNWCGLHATTDALRLRTAPGTDTGTVLGLLDTADRMTPDARSGDWVHVTLSGRSGRGIADRTAGWVAARYLVEEPCTVFD